MGIFFPTRRVFFLFPYVARGGFFGWGFFFPPRGGCFYFIFTTWGVGGFFVRHESDRFFFFPMRPEGGFRVGFFFSHAAGGFPPHTRSGCISVFSHEAGGGFFSPCSGLTLAGCQVPTIAALSLPSTTGQGEKIKRKARGSR